MQWLDNIPWTILIVGGVIIGLKPVRPEPHIFETVRRLMEGEFIRLIDIFDFFMHISPIFLLIAKSIREVQKNKLNHDS